ncbi:MAG: hypothetical protein V4548_06880 [Bacteroidota bacterium]
MGVEEFWIEFLSTLKKGDVNQIKLMSTERGFEKLVAYRKLEEYSNWLINLGNRFDNKHLAWAHQSLDKSILSIGITDDIRSVYPTGLVFIKVDGKWKFDLLLGAK